MELSEAIRRNPMTPFQWLVVGLCIVLTMVDGYEILITSYTLPALTEHWQLTKPEQGLVASFGTLGMGIGAVLLSPLADRLGRRRYILGSLALIVVAMVLAGLAPSFGVFLAFRFVGGLFLGSIVPSINVLVAEYSNSERRGTVMGIYGIGLPLGAAVGGFLSAPLIEHFTWRGPYFFAAAVTAVLFAVAAVGLPESVGYLVTKRPTNALADYNKIAARMGHPPVEELPQPAAVLSAKGRIRSVFQGRMLPRTLLLWVSYVCLIGSFYFANSLTAKLVAETTGNPNFGIRAQAMVAFGGVLGALLFAYASRRLHARVVTSWLMLAGVAIFFSFAAFFTNQTMVLILAVLVGLAVNGGVAAFHAISPTIYELAIRASAVGLMMGVGRVVAFFAPNIATFLQSQGFAPADLYRLYGAALIISAAAVFALHLNYRGRPDAMEAEDDAMSPAVEVSAAVRSR